MRQALAHGVEVLHRVCGTAAARLLARRGVGQLRFFDPREQADLAEAIASVRATSELLGRALVRDYQQREEKAGVQESLRIRESADGSCNPLPLPVCLQGKTYSCGAAAMQSVLAFHGLDEGEASLARMLGTDPVAGTRPAEIIALARSAGLTVDDREGLTVEDMAHSIGQGAPVLCPVQMHGGGHWVAVCGMGQGTVRLMDPSAGMVEVPRAEFEAAWHDRDADGVEYVRYGIAIGPAKASRLFEELGRGDVPLLSPERALEYFRQLLPPLPRPEEITVYTGTTSRVHAAQLLRGISPPSPGDYGTGYYTTTDPTMAAGYASGEAGAGVVVRAAIPRGARIVPVEDVERLHQAAVERGEIAPTLDLGEFARSIGIDAISVPHKSYINVVNPAVLRPAGVKEFMDGVDPLRWGSDLRRSAFTLARTTEQEVLERVHSAITAALESGEAHTGHQAVAQVLTSAGLSPENPQYAEMVFRTNAMDAYNQGAWSEFRDPDVAATFPVWQYSNPHDSRSRPEHAARNGLYYPAGVIFEEVRGTDAADVCNCRCTFVPISKYAWRRLKAQGARIAPGYQDVAA